MNKPPKVEVTWIDSCTYGGWMELDEALTKKVAQCMTAGYLLTKEETHVTIAQSISDADNDVGELMCIPCSAIEEIREL